MMPRRVRKLRSLFLLSDSNAMRAASVKEALGRNLRFFEKVISAVPSSPKSPIYPSHPHRFASTAFSSEACKKGAFAPSSQT